MKIAQFIMPDIRLDDETNSSITVLERYGVDKKELISYALQCRLGYGADDGLIRFSERFGGEIDECVKDEETHTGMVNDFVSDVYSSVCSIYEEICLALKYPIDTIELNAIKIADRDSLEVTVNPQHQPHRPMVVTIIAT